MALHLKKERKTSFTMWPYITEDNIPDLRPEVWNKNVRTYSAPIQFSLKFNPTHGCTNLQNLQHTESIITFITLHP